MSLSIETPNKHEFRNAYKNLNYRLLVKLAEQEEMGLSKRFEFLTPDCGSILAETEKRKYIIVQTLLNFAAAGIALASLPLITSCDLKITCKSDAANWLDNEEGNETPFALSSAPTAIRNFSNDDIRRVGISITPNSDLIINQVSLRMRIGDVINPGNELFIGIYRGKRGPLVATSLNGISTGNPNYSDYEFNFDGINLERGVEYTIIQDTVNGTSDTLDIAIGVANDPNTNPDLNTYDNQTNTIVADTSPYASITGTQIE